MQLNPESPEQTLLRRVDRLKFLAGRYRGRWNAVLETEIFLILEAQNTPRQILCRFFCYYASITWGHLCFRFHWNRRLWWYRYVRGWSHKRVMAFFEEEVADGDDELLKLYREHNQGDDCED